MSQPTMSHSRVRPHLPFVLVLVAIAAGLWSPTAADAAPATQTSVEAETLTITAGAGTMVSDAAASGGRAALVWSNGSLFGTVRPTAAVTSILVRARPDVCQGAPSMTVRVDGQILGSRTVSGAGWTDYAIPASIRAGSHSFDVRFDNDYLGSGCDRNLYVDTIRLTGSTPAAPAGGCAFGLSQGDGSNRGLGGALATATQLGRTLREFNFYLAWTYGEPFPTDVLTQARANGVLPSITWEPWDPAAGVDQPRYRLSTIAAGGFDDYIDRWARAAAAYGGPVKIRFAHEMNGTWYPWSAATNGNSPATYIAAFRHVQDRFDAAGATNVIWVWSPNIVPGMPVTLASVWPGARYVDAIGIDGYNGGADEPSMGGWRSPRQVFADTLAQIDQLAPTTPVYIAETGSAEGGGDKAAWIRELFAYLATTRVSGVDWFEFGGRADWRLTSSVASAAAARAFACGA